MYVVYGEEEGQKEWSDNLEAVDVGVSGFDRSDDGEEEMPHRHLQKHFFQQYRLATHVQ